VTEPLAKVGRDVATNVVHGVGEKGAITVGTVVGGAAVTAALSAGIAQMEYENKRQDIKDLYKEEIAAQLGKSENKVRSGDLDTIAKANRTVSEQLTKEKKQRNLNIGTIFAATAVAIGVTLFAGPAVAAVPFLAASPILAFVAKAAIALIAYSVVKKPIQNLGNKMFGMDYKTSHERIESIHRDHEAGKSISRERVFAVFVHANPELDKFIESRYGKKYDALNVADKLAVTEALGGHLDVNRITDDINHGRIKATELAFAVDGRMSGVLRKMGDQPKTVLQTVKHKLLHTADVMATGELNQDTKQENEEAKIHEAHKRPRMTHVERLAQQRAMAAFNQQRG
jgi:hypothetical protein